MVQIRKKKVVIAIHDFKQLNGKIIFSQCKKHFIKFNTYYAKKTYKKLGKEGNSLLKIYTENTQ